MYERTASLSCMIDIWIDFVIDAGVMFPFQWIFRSTKKNICRHYEKKEEEDEKLLLSITKVFIFIRK